MSESGSEPQQPRARRRTIKEESQYVERQDDDDGYIDIEDTQDRHAQRTRSRRRTFKRTPPPPPNTLGRDEELIEYKAAGIRRKRAILVYVLLAVLLFLNVFIFWVGLESLTPCPLLSGGSSYLWGMLDTCAACSSSP